MDISVCIGSACHLKGSYDVIKEFQELLKEYKLEDKITLKGAFCLNHCTEAVSTKINDGEVISMNVDKVKSLLKKVAEENKWNI
ncbi:NADH dehydrogenase subunit E [Candidatus Izimaplasma bacterium HR1]|jgi:NADH:ubiquinone oxidoreductase subunit E|uniref:(2Fe-2S) ferredoxin domain-containing protein n=1 Tax=Candidatus Izimoplasma sp. HR1 TaxID=1541959 RepID=UPI0004F7A66C|nr:NADH dehydrogenase subunit E [Candidatus Izimaplasma bacterium HR1]